MIAGPTGIPSVRKDWTHEYKLGELYLPVSELASNSGGIHWASLYDNFKQNAGNLMIWSKLTIKDDLPPPTL